MIIGRQILHFATLTSTSDKAGELALLGEPEGTVVWADEQSQGRGQRGTVWFSPSGGLYFSIILKPHKDPQNLIGITPLAARAIGAVLGLPFTVKLPNDVLVEGKKISGILTEKKAPGFLIMGIGVNLNVEDFPAELQTTAISLHRVTGKITAPQDFLTKLLAELDIRYSKFLRGKL